MSSVLNTVKSDFSTKEWVRWWPIIVGVLALYLPTYYLLAQGAWDQEENSHGPIILAIVLWLLWQVRTQFSALPDRSAPIAGSLSLALGLFLYVLGRSQAILPFEVGSQIFVYLGIALLVKGWRGARVVAFPILFLLFLVPLPGFFVTAITGPLKREVSAVAEQILYALGYPIARSGVVLSVGPYQLLVADACSGLNSMYSLSALGLLYVFLMRYRNLAHIGLLLLSIFPVAFAANVARVVILALITYHFGDEAGQGFLHGFAGIVLFVIAMSLLFLFDRLLRLVPFLKEKSDTPSMAKVG